MRLSDMNAGGAKRDQQGRLVAKWATQPPRRVVGSWYLVVGSGFSHAATYHGSRGAA